MEQSKSRSSSVFYLAVDDQACDRTWKDLSLREVGENCPSEDDFRSSSCVPCKIALSEQFLTNCAKYVYMLYLLHWRFDIFLQLRSFNSTLSRSTDAGDASSNSGNSGVSGNGNSNAVDAVGHKIRGIQKRISRLRSRSVERISQRTQVVRERLQQLQLQHQESASGAAPGSSAAPADQLPLSTAPRSGGHILPTPVPNRHLGQDGGCGGGGDSSRGPHQESYQGPFQGKARALVDYTPSPYDRDALKFKVIVAKQT